MSFAHRAAALCATVAVLVVPLVTIPAEASDDDADRARSGRLVIRDAADPSKHGEATFTAPRGGPLGSGDFVGIDGRTHRDTPLLVPGRNGTFYFGEEFDAACGYGAKFTRAMRRLAKLAAVIHRSGRRVVFSVGPNKTAVNKRDLRVSRVPHGRCALKGIKRQDRLLDTFPGRNYLTIRRQLEKDAYDAKGGRQMYWPIDTHWTTLSTAQFARALAERLDPKVARLQSYRRGRETIQVDLSTIGLLPETYETGPARIPTTKVRVRDLPDDWGFSWTSKPARRTWPGRTLLVGDSFVYRGLKTLKPLFRQGRFLWIADNGMQNIAAAIPQADTVVLEVVQRWLPISPLLTNSFRATVRQALARHDAGRRPAR